VREGNHQLAASTLSQDFASLLSSGDFSDIEVAVAGDEAAPPLKCASVNSPI
jgi:hypothetical protein